jgi:hypothetical protein
VNATVIPYATSPTEANVVQYLTPGNYNIANNSIYCGVNGDYSCINFPATIPYTQ